YLAHKAGEIGFRGDRLDPHNLFGYLLGGTGFFSFFFFLWFLYALIRDKGLARWIRKVPHVREVRRMLLFFLFVFLLRGVFTREILYSPTFIGSMAVIYSYYQMTKRNYIKSYIRERMLGLDESEIAGKGDA